MTKRLLHVAAASLLVLGISTVRAQTFDPRLTDDEEKTAAAGVHLPRGMDQKEFATEHESSMPWQDDSTAELEAKLEELKDQKTMSEFLEPEKAKVVDLYIEITKLKLVIAQKRVQRNALKKQGKKREAASVDREVNVLKRELKAKVPAGGALAKLLKDDED